MHTKNDQVTRGARRRRDHSPELKRQLVARSLIPGASVAAIALEAGINANLLFTWRRAHLEALHDAGQSAPAASAVLLPVTLQAPKHEMHGEPPQSAPRPSTGTIEIEIGVARVKLRGAVDEASVRNVLRALRELA
jgi:transposase